jgi:hypothetical protein
VKIYVAAVNALRRKKEREDETQFTTKIDGKASLRKHKFPQAHSMNIFNTKKDRISWDMSSPLYFFIFSVKGVCGSIVPPSPIP